MQMSILPARAGLAVVVIALFSFLPFNGAWAQVPPPWDVWRAKPLTILITASRFAETVDETLAPVSVITREDIDRTQATTVEEVLRSVPGIAVSNSGGAGQQTSLFLRGSESNHVLVLIDGVKVGSATTGATPFQNLPLALVEKIEVVRGPRSSLYGSEALGGVIQIFTKKGKRPQFSFGIGSHDTHQFDASLGGGSNENWYQFGVSYLTTSGIDACRGRPFSDPKGGAGCFAVEPDRDPYQNQSISLRGGTMLGARLQLDANFLHSESAGDFDGSFQNEADTATQLASVKATLKRSAGESSLSLSRSKDEGDNFFNGAFKSSFDTFREQASWQNDFRFGENHQGVAGVDYVQDEVSGSTAYTVNARENLGVFALWRTAFAVGDVDLAIRHDDNEQFGAHVTGSVGWGQDFAGGTRITASYGTAFTAPTFNDLYYPADPIFGGGGNPNLKPETSSSVNLGFGRRVARGRWDLNFYRTDIDDLIQLDSAFRPYNLSEANTAGVELAGVANLANWHLGVGLTFQNPEDAGGSASKNDGKRLPRRAKEIIRLDADRQFGRYAFGVSVHAQGDAFDDAANTRKLDGYAVVDLRGQVRVLPNWVLGIKIGNAFNEEYETVDFYNQDRRNFMATLRYLPPKG